MQAPAPGVRLEPTVEVKPFPDSVPHSCAYGVFDGPASTAADRFTSRVLICSPLRPEPPLTEQQVSEIAATLGSGHLQGQLGTCGRPALDRHYQQAESWVLRQLYGQLARAIPADGPTLALLRQLWRMVGSLMHYSWQDGQQRIQRPQGVGTTGMDSWFNFYICFYICFASWFDLHGHDGRSLLPLANTAWQRQRHERRFAVLMVVRCCSEQGSSLVLQVDGSEPFAMPMAHLEAYFMAWDGEGRGWPTGERLLHGANFPRCTVRASFLSFLIRLEVLAPSSTEAIRIVAQAWDRWQQAEEARWQRAEAEAAGL